MNILKNTKTTAVLSIALIQFGCGEKSQEEAVSAPLPEDSRQLVIFTWEEYCSQVVIADFERETGIKVQTEFYENIGELSGRFQSTPEAFDLVMVDDVTLAEFIEVKLLQKIDKSKLTNFKNLDPRYVNQAFDPQNRYSVPYNWGTNLVAYRSDEIENPEHSWDLLWKPELTGKVVMLDSEPDIYSATLLSLGYSVNTEDEKQLDECTRKLVDHAERLEARYAELPVAEESLISGKAWAALMYSGDAGVLAESNPNIAYFIPKEGAPLWLDSLALSRDAKNTEEAHEFLNFLLRAEVAAENTNFLWGGSPNAAAIPLLDRELVEDTSIYPPKEILEKCDFYASPSARRNAIMNQGMKQILDASRSRKGPETKTAASTHAESIE